jgi:hypothetical protein
MGGTALVAILLYCAPLLAAATWLDRLSAAFRPIDGYVVQSAGDQWIIDLDQHSGIRTGDVFGVMAAGEKVVHPVTGKVLGTLDARKAMLQVTRIMDGYSFARSLEGDDRIASGDRIRRFEKIPALFWDYSGSGRLLSEQLAARLPHLDWQSYETAQAARPQAPAPPQTRRNALYFVFTGRQLAVRGPDFLPLAVYEVDGSGTGRPAAVEPAPSPPAEEPLPRRTDSPIAFAPILADADTVGILERVTLNAAFVTHENSLLMAHTDGSKITIHRVADRLVPLTVADTPVPAKILALNWWQPAAGQALHLAVVTWYDKTVRSMLFRLEGRDLVLVRDLMRRILGTFDIDSDGRPETLLGQRLDREEFFGRDIVQLVFENGKTVQQKPPLSLPPRFTVLGGTIADLTGDGRPETVFVRTGLLYIYAGEKRLYTSPKQMGGSLNYLVYDIDPTAKEVQTTQVFIEVAPVAHDLDGDGRPELVAVAADRPAITSPGMGLRSDRFRLAVLKFQDGRFFKGGFKGEMDQAVQGLTVKDDRVLFVITEPGSLFGNQGSSQLLGYPLAAR